MIGKTEILRQLPSVDKLLSNIEIQHLMDKYNRRMVLGAIREVLEETRKGIHDGAVIQVKEEKLVMEVSDKLNRENTDKLKEVVNGTGVVIHTNLGRAPLSEEAARKMYRLASRYINLEYALEEGKRGYRHDIVKDLLCKITGAEDALVVNNNAAAVLLVLSAMAAGKEVVISRGQLVEIGGSFRVPEVMEQGGARLVGVGTTNKTYISDYERAVNEDTGLLLKVHTSNYRVCGFTSEVMGEQLVKLGRKYGIPVVEDLGSGIFVDLTSFGLTYEPTVQESINAGMDVVTISGDKLLGGPQAGIILGKQEYIKKIGKHPLARAVRIDKLTLAALENTLKLYLDEERAIQEIPVLRMLTLPIGELDRKAQTLKEMLKEIKPFAGIEVEKEYSRVGGGSMPLEQIETRVVSIIPDNIKVSRLDELLRNFEISIVGRISQDKYIIDVRTVFEDQFTVIVKAIKKVLGGGSVD